MRILVAGLAAVAAFALAAPAFAQTDPATDPTAAPAKPKPGTAAYCQTLKSATAKSQCLSRVQSAKAAPATTHSPKAKTKAKAKTTPAAPKPDTTAQAPATSAPVPQSTVAVPPLPQKTI
jgi:histone H1/5